MEFTPLGESIQDGEQILPAVRSLIHQHPQAAYCPPETVARLLWVLRYLPRRPDASEVEAALEALELDDGIAA